MLWLLLACTGSGLTEQAVDLSVPLTEALSLCAGSSDIDEAGSCTVAALQARGQISQARCADIKGRWRGKCVLQASETAHGPLDRRYQDCGAERSDARQCRFRLWQADVLALQPGHPDAPLEVEGMRAVVSAHKRHGGEIHPGIGDEMWTRFWGAWWEQQGSASPTDPTHCEAFQTVIDVHFCKTWAPAAATWLESHRQSPDKQHATDGAPGGPESTPP
jgi:hypothetical protein